LAGKTVTLSFYARAGANYSAASNALSVTVLQGTGTDQNFWNGYTGQTTAFTGTATLTTTWQRFTVSGSFASTTTELGFYFSETPVGTAGTNDYFEVTGVQLELGSTATAFSRAGGTIQGELAACQRYYERFTSEVTYGTIGTGSATSANVIQLQIPFKVTKRGNPTAIDTSAMSTFYYQSGASNGTTPTTVFYNGASTNTQWAWVEITKSASFTAGSFYQVIGNNTTAAYIGLSSEL
jgi:hypothetical protein